MNRTAAFTICAKNYLHAAITLHKSIASNHPDWKLYVIIVDDLEFPEPLPSLNFNILKADQLPIQNFSCMCFQYTLLELCTAVKPFAFDYFLNTKEFERVIYFDPDIKVYSPMSELEALYATGAGIILTPHLTGPLDDGFSPGEKEILQCGTWNLGFCAIDNSVEAREFIKWWEKRLEKFCVVDLGNGYFVDQKWCDLVPGLFSNFGALRHEGYNVAYWNIPHRNLTRANKSSAIKDDRKLLQQVLVNNVALRFFHFSGFALERPQALSIHENRRSLRDNPVIQDLVTDYAKDLLRNGYDRYRNLPNRYSTFANGNPISFYLRRHVLSERQKNTPLLPLSENPFESADFFSNYSLSTHPILRFRLSMSELWLSRSELQRAFPHPLDNDLESFFEWLVGQGAAEKVLTSSEINSAREELQEWKRKRVSESQEAPLHISGQNSGTPIKKLRFAENILNRFQKQVKLTERASGNQNARTSSVMNSIQVPNEAGLIGFSGTEPSSIEVNLIGYIQSVSGVGESIRNCVQSLSTQPIGFSVHDLSESSGSSKQSALIGEPSKHRTDFPINILHVNADSIPGAFQTLTKEQYLGKYNIGYWHWELPTFPTRFDNAFEHLDEIWTCSSFTCDAISSRTNLPVQVIPHSLTTPTDLGVSRERFGLPTDRFLFLVMCDMFSYCTRKNPLAAIRAFSQLDSANLGAGLVVKLLNSYWDVRSTLEIEEALSKVENCYVIDETLSRSDVWLLQNSCDSLVSLHRSEGFGLCLAEAMALGKPVIATNWSGNLEFMNPSNSCLVDYRLIELEQDIGPYQKGQLWADPDVTQATHFMERLISDEVFRNQLSTNAKHQIAEKLSPVSVGSLYLSHLERILGAEPRTKLKNRA